MSNERVEFLVEQISKDLADLKQAVEALSEKTDRLRLWRAKLEGKMVGSTVVISAIVGGLVELAIAFFKH